jgi:hypothetical protein
VEIQSLNGLGHQTNLVTGDLTHEQGASRSTADRPLDPDPASEPTVAEDATTGEPVALTTYTRLALSTSTGAAASGTISLFA